VSLPGQICSCLLLLPCVSLTAVDQERTNRHTHTYTDAARDAVCNLPGDAAGVHNHRFGYAGLPWTNFVSIDDDGAYSPPNAVITNSPFAQMGCGLESDA
jgi:hypothetical protein